ncbi:MAG: hypothetical protein HC772_10275 [Leptolyngbyaceae cyanobacterium CRU_2_3]|nr:hypothetical protein [Leptolyngbyaceae cyanobacterium CRU_2_3]
MQISASLNLVRQVFLDSQAAATPEALALPHLPPHTLLPEIFERQAAALAAVQAALPEKGWVELAEDTAGIDYIVSVNNAGEYEISDSSGIPFKNIQPALKLGDPDAPALIVNRLTHLAKYQTTSELDNADTDSPLSGKLTVEWLGTSDRFETGDVIPPKAQLTPFADPNRPVVKGNDYVFLSIRNDSQKVLNVVALNLAADWSIEQILPATELFLTLEPGRTKVVPLRPMLEGEGDAVENVVKVFATVDQANFRPLELPSLDQPLISKTGTRSLQSLSPLETLFAAIDDEQPKTRKLTVAASPSTEWTTKQVTLTIKRQ